MKQSLAARSGSGSTARAVLLNQPLSTTARKLNMSRWVEDKTDLRPICTASALLIGDAVTRVQHVVAV